MNALSILLAAVLLVGCSSSGGNRSRPPNYQVDYGCEPKQTKEKGRADAKRHIDQGAIRIIRYDMPPVRTGVWDSYYRPFIDLEIDEVPSAFDSLEYCRACNAVMDHEIKRRYGSRYLAVCADILPPPEAKHFLQETSVPSHSVGQ